MKKVLTIVSVALFGAVLGFACGGGQKPAAESTLPTTEGTEPATTDPAAVGVEGGMVGGDAYGGDAYGGDAYGGAAGGDEGW